LTNVVFVVCTGADRRTLGDERRLTGAIVCMITKSANLITAQFNIAALFVHGPKSNHHVAMSQSTVKRTVGYPSDSLASCFKKVTQNRILPKSNPWL